MVILPTTGGGGTTAGATQPTAGNSGSAGSAGMIATGGGTGGTAVDPSMGGAGNNMPAAGAGGNPNPMGGSGGAGAGGSAGSEPDPVDAPTEKFSFFVTSLEALQDLSNNEQGFGGDLRFGEMGAGAGLRGADKICATIADRSMPNASAKGWRAFLSAKAGEDGKQVNAVDRIGAGPWYDRLGRLVAMNKADFLHFRPKGDAAIINDLPNEDGVPNHDPDGMEQVDNHDTLTGSNYMGQLFQGNSTCLDWTSAEGKPDVSGKPRVGHSWLRMGGGGRPGGMMGGGDADGYGHWLSSLTEAGCAPGVRLMEMGGPKDNDPSVGSGGGYGGFYCFALKP